MAEATTPMSMAELLNEIAKQRKSYDLAVIKNQKSDFPDAIDVPVETSTREVIREVPVEREPDLPDYDRSGTNWMAAAIPLISQALIGGSDGLREGAAGASKTLLQNEKSRSDFNQKLMSLAASRRQKRQADSLKSDRGRYQYRNMRVGGKTVLAKVDTASGEFEVVPDTALAYRENVATDPMSGKQVAFSGLDSVAREVDRSQLGQQGSLQDTTPKEAKINQDIVKDLDKKLGPKKEVYQAASAIADLLENPNQFSTVAISKQLNTLLEGRGRMTDKDAVAFADPPTLDAITNRLNIMSTGRYDPQIENEIRSYLTTLVQSVKRAYNADLDRAEEAYSSIYPGMNVSRAISPFRSGFKTIKPKENVQQAKKNPPIEFRKLVEKYIPGRGKVFFRQDDKGNYVEER